MNNATGKQVVYVLASALLCTGIFYFIAGIRETQVQTKGEVLLTFVVFLALSVVDSVRSRSKDNGNLEDY